MTRSVKSLSQGGRPSPTESAEQRRIFLWAAVMGNSSGTPELSLLYAVPNGGSRRPTEAKIMKAEGVKAGVPDIHLPVSRIHHSLYIELKREHFASTKTYTARHGTISTDQIEWLEKLNKQGHWAVVCKGADHAIATLEAYLDSDQELLDTLNRWWVSLDPDMLRRVTKIKTRCKRKPVFR